MHDQVLVQAPTYTVTRAERELRQGHRGAVLWLTGLPSSGKSTVAAALEVVLFSEGFSPIVLDGDAIRSGLNTDLGFTVKDRTENIRRIGEVAKLLAAQGHLVIAAVISPIRTSRDAIRAAVPSGDFIEVHIRCPLELCESRDVKGLYKKARAGELTEFTGISAPYEDPLNAELVVDTSILTPEESAEIIFSYLCETGHIHQ